MFNREAKSADPASQTDVQNTIQDVLSDPGYRHLREIKPVEESSRETPGWLRDFLEWLFGDGSGVSGGSGTGSMVFGEIIFYVLIILVVVVLLVLLINSLNKRDRSANDHKKRFKIPEADEEAILPSQPPGDIPVNEYERRAVAFARQGDFKQALRELVLGSMSWIERAGLIRYRRGLTNRDYIRAIWRRQPHRDGMIEIVDEFERVFYGRREADAQVFSRCLNRFRHSFAVEHHSFAVEVVHANEE